MSNRKAHIVLGRGSIHALGILKLNCTHFAKPTLFTKSNIDKDNVNRCFKSLILESFTLFYSLFHNDGNKWVVILHNLNETKVVLSLRVILR